MAATWWAAIYINPPFGVDDIGIAAAWAQHEKTTAGPSSSASGRGIGRPTDHGVAAHCNGTPADAVHAVHAARSLSSCGLRIVAGHDGQRRDASTPPALCLWGIAGPERAVRRAHSVDSRRTKVTEDFIANKRPQRRVQQHVALGGIVSCRPPENIEWMVCAPSNSRA